MKPSQPPRLAVTLLGVFAAEDEALVGDLIEEYRSGRSAAWFWRQTVHVVGLSCWRRVRTVLVGAQPTARGSGYISLPPYPAAINASGSPVPGIGGLGLLALGVLVSIVRPEAWWLVLYGLLGGMLVGVTMIVVRRRRGVLGPNGRVSTLLLDRPSEPSHQ